MKAEGRGSARGCAISISPLLGLVLCAALAACAAAPQAPRAPQASVPTPLAPTARAEAAPAAAPAPATPVVLADLGAGQTLTLRLGETAQLGAGDASVSLDRVVEDSRCPTNARCIWQGRVVLAGSVSVGGRRLPFTLGTLRGFEDAPTSVEAGPYTLRIAGVEPYPDTPEGIAEEAYVLSLAVE